MGNLTFPLIWQLQKDRDGEMVCCAEVAKPDGDITHEYIIYRRDPTGDGAAVRYDVAVAVYEGESPRGPYWREAFAPYRYFSLNQAQWAAECHRFNEKWPTFEAALALSRIDNVSHWCKTNRKLEDT